MVKNSRLIVQVSGWLFFKCFRINVFCKFFDFFYQMWVRVCDKVRINRIDVVVFDCIDGILVGVFFYFSGFYVVCCNDDIWIYFDNCFICQLYLVGLAVGGVFCMYIFKYFVYKCVFFCCVFVRRNFDEYFFFIFFRNGCCFFFYGGKVGFY